MCCDDSSQNNIMTDIDKHHQRQNLFMSQKPSIDNASCGQFLTRGGAIYLLNVECRVTSLGKQTLAGLDRKTCKFKQIWEIYLGLQNNLLQNSEYP